MTWIRIYLLVSLLQLFGSVVVAQPGPATTRLFWKIAVKEGNKTTTIDSTTWRKVNFRSGNAKISYRFIPETNYFEIRLKSMAHPELIVSYADKELSFPQINHFEMGYYKKVVLGEEPVFDPAQTGIRTGKAFFNDPEEHLRYQVHNSTDVLTICPVNILLLGDRNNPKSKPVNHHGLISLTKFKPAQGHLFCDLVFRSKIDTVNVPTDLKPRSLIRFNLTTTSPDQAVCPEPDSVVYYSAEKLPVYSGNLDVYYQLSIDGKSVNQTLRIPHKFLYTRTGLPDNWIHVPETEPTTGIPNTRTLFYDREYLVTLRPAAPTTADTLTFTVTNRLSNFTDKRGRTEYQIAEDELQSLGYRYELRLSIGHDCGTNPAKAERTYQIKIPPLKNPGKYHFAFSSGFLSTGKHTTQKHCFEHVPATGTIEIK